MTKIVEHYSKIASHGIGVDDPSDYFVHIQEASPGKDALQGATLSVDGQSDAPGSTRSYQFRAGLVDSLECLETGELIPLQDEESDLVRRAVEMENSLG